MNKKQMKKMVDWMYSKDNPNQEYNKKYYGSKKETLNSLKRLCLKKRIFLIEDNAKGEKWTQKLETKCKNILVLDLL